MAIHNGKSSGTGLSVLACFRREKITGNGKETTAIPTLERAIAFFEAGEVDFPKKFSLQKAEAVREAIRKIETSDKHPELKSID